MSRNPIAGCNPLKRDRTLGRFRLKQPQFSQQWAVMLNRKTASAQHS
uniref:Uncharacterized protein n=1 Tax=Desertifilum tharense IPPAS B-1220 TaxID=1781255 RepID=A0ACD5GNC5_9CYAN